MRRARDLVWRERTMLPALKPPYLLFLGDAPSLADAKTATGIAYWHRERCCGQLRLPGCNADTGLPDLNLEAARKLGARSLIIGIAPMGGRIRACMARGYPQRRTAWIRHR